MPEELIQTRLAALTPEYRSFVEGDFTTEVSISFGEAREFTERKMEILENALMFYLLFFFSQEETVDFISQNCNLSRAQALELFLAIKTTIPETIRCSIESGYYILNNQGTPEALPLASEIAETEKEFAAIQGIRTMAADMQHVKNPGEVVHSSSQAELLNRNVPTASPEPSSRWETDR